MRLLRATITQTCCLPLNSHNLSTSVIWSFPNNKRVVGTDVLYVEYRSVLNLQPTNNIKLFHLLELAVPSQISFKHDVDPLTYSLSIQSGVQMRLVGNL